MKMEQQGGGINTLISISSTVFAWVTFKDVQAWLTIVATLVSITTGVFACLYYYRKIKTLKK